MSDVVYHFTDAARLPWIIASGALRPGRNQIGGYPVDFLWATTDSRGDRTAAAWHLYRTGHVPLVRIALPADAFERWPAILQRFPQWTAADVQRLEAKARVLGSADFTGWRARAEPLPTECVLNIEAKAYGTSRWQPVDLTTACMAEAEECVALDALSSERVDVRAMAWGGVVFLSVQIEEPGLPTEYRVQRMTPDEWAEWISGGVAIAG